MNKLTIIGNLTRDPELRSTQSGHEVCSFTVAVNRRGGNGSDDADFFRVAAWDKLAKVCNDYLAKGRKVCVVGPVSVKMYQSAKGETRADMEVRADDVEFLSPRSETQEARVAERPVAGGFTAVETDELPF